MARRARKGVEASQIAIIAGIVLAIGAIVFFVANRGSDPFVGISELPVETFVNNGRSLTKRVFKIEGKIRKKEQFTESRGQFMFVELQSANGVEDVGVLFPPEFDSANLGAGDDFTAKVEVQRLGTLTVLELKE